MRADRLRHALEEVRVAGEVDGRGVLRPCDDVAERRHRRAERVAAAVVDGRDGADRHAVELELVACRDLVDGREPGLAQPPARCRGGR